MFFFRSKLHIFPGNIWFLPLKVANQLLFFLMNSPFFPVNSSFFTVSPPGYGGCGSVQLETQPLESQRGKSEATRKFDFQKAPPRNTMDVYQPLVRFGEYIYIFISIYLYIYTYIYIIIYMYPLVMTNSLQWYRWP